MTRIAGAGYTVQDREICFEEYKTTLDRATGRRWLQMCLDSYTAQDNFRTRFEQTLDYYRWCDPKNHVTKTYLQEAVRWFCLDPLREAGLGAVARILLCRLDGVIEALALLLRKAHEDLSLSDPDQSLPVLNKLVGGPP